MRNNELENLDEERMKKETIESDPIELQAPLEKFLSKSDLFLVQEMFHVLEAGLRGVQECLNIELKVLHAQSSEKVMELV